MLRSCGSGNADSSVSSEMSSRTPHTSRRSLRDPQEGQELLLAGVGRADRRLGVVQSRQAIGQQAAPRRALVVEVLQQVVGIGGWEQAGDPGVRGAALAGQQLPLFTQQVTQHLPLAVVQA